MRISGSYTELGLYGLPKLSEVETTSEVYSKRQARVEFERFLNATDLPELTKREEERGQDVDALKATRYDD